jgi:DNA-binding PadR family transcriptional regulator
VRLTKTQAANLEAVLVYETRYGKGLWAGRDGTDTDTLNSLVELGLLTRERDENGLRWWYRLTPAGREIVG